MSTWNTFKDKYFHICDEEGYVKREGSILELIGENIAVVQYFDWVVETYSIKAIWVKEIVDNKWCLYDSVESMYYAIKHGIVKKKDNIKLEGKRIEELVNKASPALREVFYILRGRILELSNDVYEKVVGPYVNYCRYTTMIQVTPQAKNNCLLILIKMGDKEIHDPKGWTNSIPGYPYRRMNTRFRIEKQEQVDYAMELIKQAYDYVP